MRQVTRRSMARRQAMCDVANDEQTKQLRDSPTKGTHAASEERGDVPDDKRGERSGEQRGCLRQRRALHNVRRRSSRLGEEEEGGRLEPAPHLVRARCPAQPALHRLGRDL